MSKKLIIILSIIMIFNFISIPKQAYAIDPLTLTLGALYTYEVAQALYLTILTATAVGVTFATIEEWKNYHDMLEGTSPGPIEQYPEWENAREEVQQSKAEIATNHWFEQWELEALPGGGGDPDPKNNKKGILALLGGSAIMGGFINKFISMFQKLELEEGENNVGSMRQDRFTDGENLIEFRYTHIPNTDYDSLSIYVNDKLYRYGGYKVFADVKVGTTSSFKVINTVRNEDEIIYTLSYSYTHSSGKQEGEVNLIINKKVYPTIVHSENEPLLKVNVDTNSPILNNNSYDKIPQPNLIPIPRHNPSTTPLLNPDGTPKPGIQRILNPDGSIEERFYGDVDDLIEDVVMNTPIDEILNPDTNPSYIIEPGPDYIKIKYPDTEPGEDPGEEPGQEPGQEDLPEIDFSPLMGIELTEKFPFSLVSDVKKSVNILTAPPKPPNFEVPMVDKTIIIDFEVFNKWAVITRSFLSLTFVIILVLITRRFIG